MNSTSTSAKPDLFFCLGCDRWHCGNGQYAALPVFIPSDGFKYELCPTCELTEQAVALETERQRLDIERDLCRVRRFATVMMCCLAFCAHAQPRPLLPDPALTPGSVRTNTVEGLLAVQNTKEIRNVPERVRHDAFNRYGIPYDRHVTQNYEVDHLISLELGGDNSVSNLWPQSYLTLENAHLKDKLENYMARTVKAEAKTNLDGATATLRRYQAEIATNWIAAYTNHLVKGLP